MMTPPTVAPGSAEVMRRHGTPHDAVPSSFYVPTPLQHNSNMGSAQENSAGNIKPKKSWGDRLKLGKSDKSREERPQTSTGVSTSPDNNYLLQEYRNKYGTLSSGSALSKSMKYAETWLYGSVAVRPTSNGSTPRPSLFLYHHPPPPVAVIPANQAMVIPPGSNYAVVMCSCPEFLTGTTRSKKSSTAVCKKCGGSRMLWNMNKGGGTVRAAGTVRGGTVRGMGGTLRLGGGSSGQNRVRPSLLNLTSLQTNSPSSKPSTQQPLKATTPDPYDLMRRNRLGGVNNNESPIQYEVVETTGLDSVRVRAKSTSPCRRRRSPSPPSSTNVGDKNGGRMSRRDLAWDREYQEWNSNADIVDNSKRKSILECDVTAYELIAKYLKNGNCPPPEKEGSRNGFDKMGTMSDDDILDDELSDGLSDNALENSTRKKIPTSPRGQALSSFQSKTDSNIKTYQNNKGVKPATQSMIKNTGNEKQSSPTARKTGVTIGGQRIRLFNESSSPSISDRDHSNADVNNVSDFPKLNGRSENSDVEPRTSRNTPPSSSLIPRLSSPRRPPRRMKSPAGRINNNNNEYVIQGAADGNEIESAQLGGGGGGLNSHADESSPAGITQVTKDGRSPSTEGVCIIKSILKKPSTLSPGDTATSLKTFGDTISKPDSAAAVAAAAVSSEHSPSPEVFAGSGSSDFYLPTFQEFKRQIRKKKQVQFKVSNDVTVLQPVEEEDLDDTPVSESLKAKKSECSTNNLPVSTDSSRPVGYPFQYERKNKDRLISKEEGQTDNSNAKVEETSPESQNSDKDSHFARLSDDKDKKGCDVNLQYFGEGDVAVVNTGSNGNGEKSAGDVPTTSPRSDAPPVVGGITENTTPSTSESAAEDLVKDRGTVVTLRRSQSERLLPTGSLRGCDSKLQQCPDFNDTMRLRLRPGRPDIRQVFSDPGATGTYTSNETPKRPQRMLSPGRPRPKEPPPPPPPPSSDNPLQPLPELPPRQIFPFTKKQIEQMNNQARQFSLKSQNKQKRVAAPISNMNKPFDPEPSVPSNIRPVSWSPLMESTITDSFESGKTHVQVKKKEHRHSDPGPAAPKFVVHIENSREGHPKDSSIQIENEVGVCFLNRQNEVNLEERNSLPKMSSRVGERKDGNVSTIVTVSSSAPGSPLADIHRLQIKNKEPLLSASPEPQRRTSILINGEESSLSGNSTSLLLRGDISPVKKDSSNKVTICVVGGSDPNPHEITSHKNISSSCTIIDTSSSTPVNVSKVQNKSDVNSLTMFSSSPNQINIIPVSHEQPQRTLLVVDHNDGGSRVLQCWGDYQCNSSTITIVDHKEETAQEPTTNIVLTCKTRGADVSSASENEQDVDILLNPVEAVKRNLVPHVCGKKNSSSEEDSSSQTSPTERLNKLIEMEKEIDDNDRETMKEGDYYMTSAASKIFAATEEENPLYCNVLSAPHSISKSSEDTLPTVLEQEEEGDDDVFKLEADEVSSIVKSDEDCRTESGNCPGDSSGCDTAPSSIEPENEGTDEDTTTSHLHLSLPFKDSETPETEKDNEQEVETGKTENESCNETRSDGEDDNIYESIKDPIYEEIPDTPPPLPLSPPPSLDELDDSKKSSRSIFEGASKYDILSYLVGAKERGIVPEETYYSSSANGDEIVEIIDGKPIQDEDDGNQNHQRMSSLDLGDLSSRVSHLSNASDSSEDSCNLIISNIGDSPSSPNKVRKSSAEIERNDSGVGSETSKSSRSRWQHCGPASSIREDLQHLCEDCDQPVETQVTDSGLMFAPLVCRKCGKKRAERKEIIAEIVETEEKYGRDLQIIMDEFYSPMLVAGLLTPEQLSAIFLNVEELLDHNSALAEKLRDNLEIALEQGDEDLLTVNIGKLFLEAAPMLHAFESYCVRQGAASLLLANLEKEKELLRIFLRVSQMENAVLRRMNLNSFLMVPVQRVTKYPLLLARLHKVTPSHHEGRDLLKQAQHKIELHLEHMNSEAKDISTTKLWRRISIMNGRRSSSETDMLSIKLRKMALDILEWNHDEVRFAMEGKLLYTNPADNNWRKSRTIKLNPINALLVTNGKPTEDYRPDPTEDSLMFPRKTGVREATLLLLKEKCGRYTQLREPLYLDKCIVCSETDAEEYFEVQELASKDTFIFKAEDSERTRLWYRQLQYHAQGMGAWRRRRNALANIMINGMQTRN